MLSTKPLRPQLNLPQKGVVIHSLRHRAESCWPQLRWEGWPPGQVSVATDQEPSSPPRCAPHGEGAQFLQWGGQAGLQ